MTSRLRAHYEAARSSEGLGLHALEPRKSFTKPIVLKEAWSWGERCPSCKCTPDEPCTVVLEDGCGEGSCVPAGAFDLPTCSACFQEEARP